MGSLDDGEVKERGMAAAILRAPKCVRNPCSRASRVADNHDHDDRRPRTDLPPTRSRPEPQPRP